MRGALISLHVEKVTPLVLWIATPRKWCPGGWYLGVVHGLYTYMDPTCLRYGGANPAFLAVLAVDRCSSGFLITGPSTVHCPPPMHGGPIKSSPQLGAPKIRYRVLCLFE